MKQIVAYSILFCLVFLNVPRTLVHDCHHDEHSHEHSSESDHGLSFDQDECFVCEFDLDIAPTPIVMSFELADAQYQRFVETKLNVYSSSKNEDISLRGPPLV